MLAYAAAVNDHRDTVINHGRGVTLILAVIYKQKGRNNNKTKQTKKNKGKKKEEEKKKREKKEREKGARTSATHTQEAVLEAHRARMFRERDYGRFWSSKYHPMCYQ